MIKVTSRLVSGAVALAMAGTVPAWADSAAHAVQVSTDSASQSQRAAAAGEAHATQAVRALHLAQATSSTAQSSGGRQSTQLQEVVVTGIRQSMESALHIKEFADTIEDSIVASDIGKLPDVTAIDAIQ